MKIKTYYLIQAAIQDYVGIMQMAHYKNLEFLPLQVVVSLRHTFELALQVLA